MQINTKSKAFQTVNYILFLAVGVLLLYLTFRNQDFGEILKAILSANLWMILPVFVAATVGGVLRALRWQILIRPLGYSPSLFNLFNSMMFGYFVNYAIPRFGEVLRCVSLRKKEGVPFTASFGTVMAERMVDLIMLALSIVAVFVLESATIYAFFNEHFFGPIIDFAKAKLFKNTPMTLITLSGVALVIYIIFSFGKKASAQTSEDKFDKMIDEVWGGLMSILKLPNYGLFILYSLLIWCMYFCTSYFWLLSFTETQSFSLSAALVVMVIGTIGKSAPTQGGGMGAYHYLVSKGLGLFGISAVVGNAYAIVNHGSIMLYQVIVGTACGLILWFTKNKTEGSEEGAENKTENNPQSVSPLAS